jgi:HD superfamily phosphohydrolase YqeK
VKTSDDLPSWSIVSEKRRAHITRVVALIDQWASSMVLDESDQRAWHDAALWHDALRDAPEPLLRKLTGAASLDASLLHGPAAAIQLSQAGERRLSVLEAIRSHTIGAAEWDATGQALYMADFLEPGRLFAQSERGYLAHQVPNDFQGTFRQVVRLRLEWALREGKKIYPETVAMWNSVR